MTLQDYSGLLPYAPGQYSLDMRELSHVLTTIIEEIKLNSNISILHNLFMNGQGGATLLVTQIISIVKTIIGGI